MGRGLNDGLTGTRFPSWGEFSSSHFQASGRHPFLSENNHLSPGKLRLHLLSDLPGLTVQSWLLCVESSLVAAVLRGAGSRTPEQGLLQAPEAQRRKARAGGRG